MILTLDCTEIFESSQKKGIPWFISEKMLQWWTQRSFGSTIGMHVKWELAWSIPLPCLNLQISPWRTGWTFLSAGNTQWNMVGSHAKCTGNLLHREQTLIRGLIFKHFFADIPKRRVKEKTFLFALNSWRPASCTITRRCILKRFGRSAKGCTKQGWRINYLFQFLLHSFYSGKKWKCLKCPHMLTNFLFYSKGWGWN